MKNGINDSEIFNLNHEQQEQVRTQWANLQHGREEMDISLSPFGDVLENFIVYPGVWHPAKVSSRYHASYLFFNNERLFANKRVLDMGTGAGIMGVVTALYGARHTVLTDISETAVKNTKENIEQYNVQDKAMAVHGDLFENIPKEEYEFIVFNQPFFSGSPESGDTISASMLNSGELIDRFLYEVKEFLAPGGILMMPSYDKAGSRNHPMAQGPKYGFDVKTTFSFSASQELQQGQLAIHELTLKV